VKVFRRSIIPVHGISLVNGVDTSFLGNTHLLLDSMRGPEWHVRVGEDELPKRIVEGKTVDTIAGGEDQVCTGRVHAFSQKAFFGS